MPMWNPNEILNDLTFHETIQPHFCNTFSDLITFPIAAIWQSLKTRIPETDTG